MKKFVLGLAVLAGLTVAAYAETCYTNCTTDAWGNQNCVTTCYDY